MPLLSAVLVMVVIAMTTTASAFAEPVAPQPHSGRIHRILSVFERHKAPRTARKKKAQCIAAVASTALCECLVKSLPAKVGFRAYTAIVTQTREDLGYDQLSAADMKLVDTTLAAREQCAGSSDGNN